MVDSVFARLISGAPAPEYQPAGLASALSRMIAGQPQAPPAGIGAANALLRSAPISEDDRWQRDSENRLRLNAPYAKPGPYATVLPADQEQAFRGWVKQNKVLFNPNDDEKSDYDMRGYFQGLQNGDPEAKQGLDPHDKKHPLHFPDKWKTPYHETFSRDSQYALPNAPYWLNQQYLVDHQGRILFNDANRGQDLNALNRGLFGGQFK